MIPNVALATPAFFILAWALGSWGMPATLDVRSPGLKIPLQARSPMSGLDLVERGQLAKRQRDAAIAKYARGADRRRSTGYNLIVDQDYDSGYYGSVAIGTPLTAFNVVLDTGSSDLWVVSDTCGSVCQNLPSFNPSSSSTFKNLSSSFFITYGQGEAAGYVAQDVVEMAGFSVANQGFAVVDAMSSSLVSSPVSGIMGFGWEPLAQTQQTPFWQSLASNGAMDSALFAFQLRRYSNDTKAQSLEPGGELTLGYANTSLYTGSIDYVDIPGTPSYWYLNLASLTVQGTSISIGSDTLAAIDTGTTNIGGPSSAIQAIYAQIPGSSPATGSWQGYYQFPCSTSVSVSVSFGGNSWTISAADFAYTAISSSECIGAFFDLGTTTASSSTSPAWIFGDSFLKNVYSVFRYNPASIGFAALSEVAISENGASGAVPSATIGTAAATVTNGARAARAQSGVLVGVAGVFVSMALWVL